MKTGIITFFLCWLTEKKCYKISVYQVVIVISVFIFINMLFFNRKNELFCNHHFLCNGLIAKLQLVNINSFAKGRSVE